MFPKADLPEEIRRSPDDLHRRLRLVFESLRAVEDDGDPLALLVEEEPPPTGDVRFDALLASVAEDLCVHQEVAPPSWVHATTRFLDGLWWVSDLASGRAHARVHTPAAFRRRGVMLDRHDLVAV